ncbi:Uncharacterized protein APZ42_017067, partial [Daphnia magna]
MKNFPLSSYDLLLLLNANLNKKPTIPPRQ